MTSSGLEPRVCHSASQAGPQRSASSPAQLALSVSPQRGDASGEDAVESMTPDSGAQQTPRTQLIELPGETWEDMFDWDDAA